ncbi:uncharacterized protein [Typha angustifolia]|uniref:uncharacterized protein n=1 Tax=Typha angustifolia TaxID=59011 RepID=UPI003C2E24CC
MMQGKLILNPYATPYVPLSEICPKKSFETGKKVTEETLDESEKKDLTTEKSSKHQLLDFASDAYDIQNMEKLASESSQKADLSFSSGNTLQDGINFIDDQNIIVEYLSSMYPGVSVDFIAGLLNANHHNVNETTDMLEQLEYGEVCEASETSGHLDPSAQKF